MNSDFVLMPSCGVCPQINSGINQWVMRKRLNGHYIISLMVNLFNCCFLNKIPEAEKTNVGILILKEIFGLFTLAVLENRDEDWGFNSQGYKKARKEIRYFRFAILCINEYFHESAPICSVISRAKPDTRER